jgi:hypothetical protein
MELSPYCLIYGLVTVWVGEMTMAVRKKRVETSEEPVESAGAESLGQDEWREFSSPLLDNEPEITAAPAAARPMRPSSTPADKVFRRSKFVTYAPYVLLFIAVASLSAIIVLLFG